ncbi:MAG: heme exporter protein CcmD [Pseudomonadota bacterium]
MAEFLKMGGYAAFIWPAYGVSAAAIILLISYIFLRSRRVKKQLAALDHKPLDGLTEARALAESRVVAEYGAAAEDKRPSNVNNTASKRPPTSDINPA